MPTLSAKTNEVDRDWHVVDATDQPLGRLASRVATVLRGKHRTDFTPHADVGDFVIVINAEKVKLTGNKLDNKFWYRHSGAPGGLKTTSYRELIAKRPEKVIEKAVWGMLPKKSLGRRTHRKLKVYAGPKHPHTAQKPEPLAL
ncbi:MAG: 50S ribosomal protein L13 [Deltaproteobacteria bacterium]|nr:50S ribosomal protein L13 [Deltaproteobacteria bacterium]